MSIPYSPAAARRIVTTLFVTQCLGSAALIANATVNAIVGATLSGRDDLAGLPGTLLLIGAAGASPWAGRLMQRRGRRPGLALGFFVGMVGMIIGGSAIVTHSFALFLLGLLLIGAARGAVDQSRYAAADAQIPDRRARAISTVVFAGPVGAIAGPALVHPSGLLLGSLAFDPLAGPMWSGAILFGLAGLLIFAFLHPDPREIGRALDTAQPETQHPAGVARPLGEIMRQPAAWLALIAMVIGQAVMVLVMSVTSLHMYQHHQGLGDVSLVIMAHTLGMFGLSIVNGALIDRMGHKAAIGAGAALLIAGSLLAPVSLMTAWLALALFLVGLGWNLCYIAGSSLLSDVLAPAERSRVQGANELVVNLASAVSSLGSGVILAYAGFTALGVIGAALSLIPLVALAWQGLSPAQVAQATVVSPD
ncbi:MAG: MFS transporter [Roseiflexaceae bacterium]